MSDFFFTLLNFLSTAHFLLVRLVKLCPTWGGTGLRLCGGTFVRIPLAALSVNLVGTGKTFPVFNKYMRSNLPVLRNTFCFKLRNATKRSTLA